ncbi:MAG: menaquinone biosynthesis protein [Deferrisomatales bacterium]|nr:menaquinone biosynthesis protein [Deferrisomatales bacterium]
MGTGAPLRVGHIGFANCTPLFLALEELGVTGVEYVTGVPTDLNRRLRCGEVDLSPSSSIEYLQHPDLYGFLPDLSISSIGAVRSVLLFSRVPLTGLGGRRVALSAASGTSVQLLRVLLETHRGITPQYVQEAEGADAVLWIGDRALRQARDGGWPHVYDLGELWFETTGTPFVFALWICRRDAWQADPAGIRQFYRTLVRAQQLAYRSYPAFAARCAEAEWLGEGALLEYWQTISYDLTAWHLRGLRRFAEELVGLGVLGAVPDLAPLAVEE